jgi:hypothetical protein
VIEGETYESFCRVGEWYRAFTGRVYDHEEVYTGRDAGCPRGLIGYVEGEAGEEEEYTHQGECGQQQIPSSKGVNRVYGRQGEDPVGDAASERCDECHTGVEAGFSEHRRGVVHDGIDTTELRQLALDYRMRRG